MEYRGGELELFEKATNWKAYWSRVVRPHVRGSVLEVGAGLGAATRVLCTGREESWLCLEPDPQMSRAIERKVERGELPGVCRAARGVLRDLPPDPRFDTILYIDVLEHVAEDRAEVGEAVRRLRPGGSLVVLAPAHGWLFSPFDAAIGHFRRYTKATLSRLIPPELEREKLVYLDSVGLLLSLANRLLLRRDLPTARQIAVWDRWVVPSSRVVDGLCLFRLGKTVVGVWTKPGGGT